MRTEEEMLRLILETAEKDERVRAVFMNGSRTNPNAPRDVFQDYDIVYVVRETTSFIRDESWITRFGEVTYMQCPDEVDFSLGEEVDFEHRYAYLTQFSDGVRIDLTLMEAGYAGKAILEDKLCIILLDKDGILPPIPASTDEDYRAKKPTEAEFLASCNEFWWCTNNIAKGLWRDELPYVEDMTNFHVRPQLLKLLSWKVGILTDFSFSVGKSGKYLKYRLPQEDYARYLATFFGADAKEAWESVFEMTALFEDTARWVGEKLGFSYNDAEGKAALRHLHFAHDLPRPQDDRTNDSER
ncbi:MAG: aminoglycoside 6-adenylyltransferase [Clostridia bacterium]|nr:aminoglycoside 6-adenylyltransferase [Clostridia bacterium]